MKFKNRKKSNSRFNDDKKQKGIEDF